ncbi:hypothetical protein CK203_048884 [Vitis vinifera]|uniref:Uncharacterized protein n=1 Tax=Vitis vinifera TaxID=29760 RepID=A0A438FKZ2_VITVI|nr:hypothetical protein CK203_048884 [Vitis vinifera]
MRGRDVVSTEKAEGRAITFSKEQFNAGLRFPLPALFKEFLHFSKIPPAFIHPNIVRVLMGCSIINMLFNLDLTLLEVLFVYSLKKGKNDIFSMSAHLPSLQLVTELPDSTKEGAKGHVVVRGACAGFLERPGRPFCPNYSMEIPGPERRGHIVDWVEKTSFAYLNKLFEIDAKERHYATLLTTRNLMAVVRESQEYVVNILPRKLPKEVVPGEYYVLKDLPIYQEKRSAASPPKKAPAKKRKLVKNGKGVKEPIPPKEFGPPPITHAAEVIIEEPVNPAPHSISSGPGHVAGLNHSGLSMSVVARLATLADEAALDSSGGFKIDCKEIEVSCSSAQDAHPEGSEVEMATETSIVPVVVPDEDAPGETHPAENVEAPNPEEESPSVASSGRNPVNDVACTPASPLATRSWKIS